MRYKILSKVYYKSEQEYDELYYSRIHSENTTFLDITIHENRAFYCMNSDLYDVSMKIMELEKKVQALEMDLPGVAIQQFANKSLIDEIFLTNDMEGVYSTRKEIKTILNENKEGCRKKRKRFSGLVTRYQMLGDSTIALNSCEDIRAIYNELVLPEIMNDDPAQAPDGRIFRKELAEVTSPTQKVIHQGLYPEEKIIDNMNRALLILNDETIPDLIRISVFHYLFGYIHPFYDGNGRTSRFISSYLLAKHMDKLISLRLSYTIKENISDYYEAFKLCNDIKNKGDLTPFILIFLGILSKAFEKLYEALWEKRKLLFEAYLNLKKMDFFDTALKKTAAYLIQAALFAVDGISTKELSKHLKISEPTVRKRLAIISEHGYLLCNQEGKNRYYKFNISKLHS